MPTDVSLVTSPSAPESSQPRHGITHPHRQVMSASSAANSSDNNWTPSANSAVLQSVTDVKSGDQQSRHHSQNVIEGGGLLIYNLEVKKKNRIIKFVIFQFKQPSSYFSVEVCCGNASGSREPPQSHTFFVTMTEDLHELFRIWSITRLNPQARNNKVAQRLITGTKLEFDKGRISRAAFDQASFSQKNRAEILKLLTDMATRLQAAARSFLVRARLNPTARKRVLPAVLPSESHAAPVSSPTKSSRKSKGRRGRKKKANASPSPASKSPRERLKSREGSRSQGRSRSRSPRSGQKEDEDRAVSRALFSQETPSEKDYMLQRSYDFQALPDEQDEGGDFNFYQYEYPLHTPVSPPKPHSPRSKTSYAEASAQSRGFHSRAIHSTGGSHVPQGRRTPQRRLRSAEQEERTREKKSLIAEAYFPPVERPQEPGRQRLLLEIQSIKREMGMALESFQTEMELVKSSIVEANPDIPEEVSHSPEQRMMSMSVHEGGLLEEGSKEDSSSVLRAIKNQSSILSESVEGMRSELLAARQEVDRLRGEMMAVTMKEDSIAEIDNEGREFDHLAKKMTFRPTVIYTETHEEAAQCIQKSQRSRQQRVSNKTLTKNTIKHVKKTSDGTPVRQALMLALKSGNAKLAGVVMRRSFEIFQDQKKIAGFSLVYDRNISLVCEVILAFLSIEEVTTFGLQLLSLVSLQQGFEDCHQVMGAAGACDVVMTVLGRYTADNTVCMQALMLAICLTNSCVENRYLLTEEKYCSIYGTLLSKDRLETEQQFVIDKTVRLLLKLTSDGPDVVSRFNSISTEICEQLVLSLHDHLRTPLFTIYCKTMTNMCSHNNSHMKQAFGARQYSSKYIECLSVYKDDAKTFKIVANMIILICGDSDNDELFFNIVTEYFVSALVCMLRESTSISADVLEVLVILLHRLSARSDFAEALLCAGVDGLLQNITRDIASKPSALSAKINMLMTLLDKVSRKTSTTSPNRRRGVVTAGSKNSLLPKKNILQAIHDCYKVEEFTDFLKMSVTEGRDSMAQQTIVRLTSLVADKRNNADLAAFLLDDIQPILDILQAFTAMTQVQVLGINLIQLLQIDYGGQMTQADSIRFLRTLNILIWGHFTSAEVCDKYLDFVLMATRGKAAAPLREFAANVETFAALQNIMSYHMKNKSVFLKCCEYVAKLSISNEVRTMVLAAGINDSILVYMYSCDVFDEKTAVTFHDTVVALCDNAQSVDQTLFFSSDETASLYLRLLQHGERNGRIWRYVLNIILFLVESSDEQHRRGLKEVNYAATLSRGLHSFCPDDIRSQLLVETVVVFLMGVLSAAPALERRFINVDTANFVAALTSKQMKLNTIVSDMALDACTVIMRLMQTVPIDIAVKDLAYYYVEEKRTADANSNESAKILQRNLRRLLEWRVTARRAARMEEELVENTEFDFFKKCLQFAVDKGRAALAEATLERLNDLLDRHAEAQQGGDPVEDVTLTRFSHSPGVVLATMSSFLSLASIQFLCLRIVHLLPYVSSGAEVTSSKDIKPHIDVFFVSLLRHMNDNVLCGETLDCLIFLTAQCESNIFSASNHISFQVISYFLKNRFDDVHIMNKLCQFVFNMCKNITNHALFGEYKIPNYIFHFLTNNMFTNDAVGSATDAIAALCGDGVEVNLHTLASCSCLKMYYSIMRRNPRNMDIHINIGRMLVSFTTGSKKDTFIKGEMLKSRLPEELQSMLQTALKASHQGIAACLLSLCVHFLYYQRYLRSQFEDANIGVVLLEYSKSEWNDVVRSIAQAGLNIVVDSRAKPTFALAKMFNKKQEHLEVNYFKNIYRIRCQMSLKTGPRGNGNKLLKERTLQREQSMVDSIPLKKGMSSHDIEMGSWFSIIPSEDKAAAIVVRAARRFLKMKAAAATREEEERRLPVLKQRAEVSSDPDELLECLQHCVQWGRMDLGLVVTRRIYLLKTSQQDSNNPKILGLFEKLTREPDILVKVMSTFTSVPVLQRQVLALLQLFPFRTQEVDMMADMGTCDAIYAIALRYPSNFQLSVDCIETLSYFANVSPRYRHLLCEDGPLKVLLHLLDKHEHDDEMLASCFALVVNVCKDSTGNQEKISETKFSLQVQKFLVSHVENVDAVSLACSVIKALCEDGDLSNLQQYFNRDFLTAFHVTLTKNQSSKVVVRQVYFLLMLAARYTGPFEDYLSRELACSDVADFLVRTMLPEAKNRENAESFFMLLILACTYLRTVPSIIPIVLKANLAGIMTQYLDPFWNNEVHKSTKYCLRVLNTWTKTSEQPDGVLGGDFSVGGDSTFAPPVNIGFDDSVSVLTQDPNDFNNIKRSSEASLQPANSLTRKRVDSDTINENDQSDIGNVDNVPDDSSLARRLNASENSLEQSFSLLEHTATHMSLEPASTRQVLHQIATILSAYDIESYLAENRSPEGIDGIVLVNEVFPSALHGAMKAFPSEKAVLLAGCKVLQSLHCDSFSGNVASFGALMADALELLVDDAPFCERMMKYCVHFSAESKTIRDQLTTAGSIQSILGVMRMHSTRLDLMKLCFRLIFHVCGGAGEAQTLLSVGGVGEVIMNILTANSSNRDMVSLVSKAIVSLCVNTNLANINDFGSFKNMQTYFFIIKANAQDAHICSSMSFVVLGILSIGKDVLLESLLRNPFALEFKELLSESSFSVEAAEVIVMLTSKVISNFSELTNAFIHVNIISDLTLYAVGHWNDATRGLAVATIRQLEEYRPEFSVSLSVKEEVHLRSEELKPGNVLEEKGDDNEDEERVVGVPSVVNMGLEGSQVSMLSAPEITEKIPSTFPSTRITEEAGARSSKFLRRVLMTRRQRSNSIAMQDIDINSSKVPLNKLIEMVVLKGRIHLAVGIMKRILLSVQSGDKGSGVAVLLAEEPAPLLSLMASFISIEAVSRDGLLVLRALSYTEETMAAMGGCGVCSLLVDIVQRYSNNNMIMCTSALKTLTFFAKGSVLNRASMTPRKCLTLVRVMENHASAQIFMVEAIQTVTELCLSCPENNAALSSSNIVEISIEFLVKFKLDKECVQAVVSMIFVMSKEANAMIIRKIASRQCLMVLFEFLRENISSPELCKTLCSTLTALVGDDLEYFLAELVAGGVAGTLCSILRSEAALRHTPSLLTPVFTLMIHYVYNIPRLTLELYRTEIPVTLEIFRSSPVWSDCRKAADIVLSKIKIDVKHVEVERKKTMRKAEKQKSQKLLHRQTSIPDTGIGDWDDMSELFTLLHEAVGNRNGEDIVLICQQISEVCRVSKGSMRTDKRLFYTICKEYVPLLLQAVRLFLKQKVLALVSLKILECFPCHKITADIANLGHFFMEMLEAHVEDGVTCTRLLEFFITFASQGNIIRFQLASADCVSKFFAMLKRQGTQNLELLELCVSYVSELCEGDRSSTQLEMCKAGVSQVVIAQLIDTMDDEAFVHRYMQLVALLCQDGHAPNMEVFACPGSMKLFLHIVRSSPNNPDIAKAVLPVLTTLLQSMMDKPSSLSQDLEQSSFMLELCAALRDENAQHGYFNKVVLEDILSLVIFIVRKVEFLRSSVVAADVATVLTSIVEDGGENSDEGVLLDADIVADLRGCISMATHDQGKN